MRSLGPDFGVSPVYHAVRQGPPPSSPCPAVEPVVLDRVAGGGVVRSPVPGVALAPDLVVEVVGSSVCPLAPSFEL